MELMRVVHEMFIFFNIKEFVSIKDWRAVCLILLRACPEYSMTLGNLIIIKTYLYTYFNILILILIFIQFYTIFYKIFIQFYTIFYKIFIQFYTIFYTII